MQILVNEQSTYKQNGKYKKNEESNGSNETNKTYRIVEQRNTSRKRVSDVSIIKEEWLAERIYFGINTYRYVSTLRAFKLGAYKGLGIKTISDLAAHLFASGEILKRALLLGGYPPKLIVLYFPAICNEKPQKTGIFYDFISFFFL